MRKLLLLSTLLVLIDQFTKVLVKGFSLFGIEHKGMYLYESRPVIGELLRWTFVENPGMAFGVDFGMPVILGLFSISASIFLIYLLKRTEKTGSTGLRLSLALILAGAVGNLIDRVFYGVFYGYGPLFYGKVVDFVDVNMPDMNIFGTELERFYIFNVADAAVSIGVILLLIFYPTKKAMTQGNPENKPDGDSTSPDNTPSATTHEEDAERSPAAQTGDEQPTALHAGSQADTERQ